MIPRCKAIADAHCFCMQVEIFLSVGLSSLRDMEEMWVCVITPTCGCGPTPFKSPNHFLFTFNAPRPQTFFLPIFSSSSSLSPHSFEYLRVGHRLCHQIHCPKDILQPRYVFSIQIWLDSALARVEFIHVLGKIRSGIFFYGWFLVNACGCAFLVVKLFLKEDRCAIVGVKTLGQTFAQNWENVWGIMCSSPCLMFKLLFVCWLLPNIRVWG